MIDLQTQQILKIKKTGATYLFYKYLDEGRPPIKIFLLVTFQVYHM